MSSFKRNLSIRCAASLAGVLMATTALSSGAQAQSAAEVKSGTQAAASSSMNATAQTPGTLNTMFAAALPAAGTAVNLYYKHPTAWWYHVKYGVHWGWVSASYIQNIGVPRTGAWALRHQPLRHPRRTYSAQHLRHPSRTQLAGCRHEYRTATIWCGEHHGQFRLRTQGHVSVVLGRGYARLGEQIQDHHRSQRGAVLTSPFYIPQGLPC